MGSEDDIKICNQTLLDEFILEFIKSNMTVIHLWDTARRSKNVVKMLGKFHLFKKQATGAVSTMFAKSALKPLLDCLYNSNHWGTAEGIFIHCKLLTYYPNEILLTHTGIHSAGMDGPGNVHFFPSGYFLF